MGKKRLAGVQPKRNGRPYRVQYKRSFATVGGFLADPVATRRVMAELDYAKKYGSANLNQDDFFYDTLYMHGAHVAEFYRRFGKVEVMGLGAMKLEALKLNGLELFLMDHDVAQRPPEVEAG